MNLPSLSPASFEDVARHQRWWEAAPRVAVVAWVASVLVPCFGVHASFALAPLALLIAMLAVPPPAPAGGYRAWQLVGVAVALCALAPMRIAAGARSGIVGTMVLEGFAPMIPWAIGAAVDNAMAPRLGRGGGRTRAVTRAVLALGVALSVGALARFHGRADPAFAPPDERASERSIGRFQALDLGCPPDCDGPARGATTAAPDEDTRRDEVAPGVTLDRRREGFGTRARLVVRTGPGAAVVALEHVLLGHQALEVSRGSSAQYLLVDVTNYRRAVVRRSDGAVLSDAEYDRALRDARRATRHAPGAFVLLSLAGVALAAWFLRVARRALPTAAQVAKLREGRVGAKGVIHFDDEGPPAALPPDADARDGESVLVMAVATAPDHAYRSDGAPPIATQWCLGTLWEFLATRRAQATAWEHGALAAAAVTQAPLLGALVFGTVP